MWERGKRITKRKRLLRKIVSLSLILIMLGFGAYTIGGEKRSISSKGVEYVLLANRTLNKANMPQKFEEKEDTPYEMPGFIRLKSGYLDEEIEGMQVFKLIPKNNNEQKVVIYFHGGGYVEEVMPFHWWFLDKIADKTGATIYVPLYPRAPKHQFQQAYEAIQNTYKEIVSRHIDSELTVMGDSAGGSMSLVVAQLAMQKGFREPDNLILISPWLDIKTDNPLIEEMELDKADPMLYYEFLNAAAQSWAGGANLSHPMLSPINGEIPTSPTISLFVGGREMLLPDSQLFYQNAKDKGIEINYYEYPQMNHVFPIYPFVLESRIAVSQIVSLIS